MIFQWMIQGQPVAQGRPRFTMRGNSPRAFDPIKSRDWKKYAVSVFKDNEQITKIDEPCAVYISAVFARPARLKRVKDPIDRLPHTGRPDADNCAKAVLDAMQTAGILVDDSCVCRLNVSKQYAAKDEQPKVEVRIEVG